MVRCQNPVVRLGLCVIQTPLGPILNVDVGFFPCQIECAAYNPEPYLSAEGQPDAASAAHGFLWVRRLCVSVTFTRQRLQVT